MTVVVLVAVLAVTTAVGLLWRGRNGRVRDVTPPGSRGAPPAGDAASRGTARAPDTAVLASLASLGVDPSAASVTLLQFSSAFCAPCRATRQVLGQVTAALPGVRHVEVDAESHLAAVRALGILRTPTVLVLDASGRVVRRASGQPRAADVVAAVAPLLDQVPGAAPDVARGDALRGRDGRDASA